MLWVGYKCEERYERIVMLTVLWDKDMRFECQKKRRLSLMGMKCFRNVSGVTVRRDRSASWSVRESGEMCPEVVWTLQVDEQYIIININKNGVINQELKVDRVGKDQIEFKWSFELWRVDFRASKNDTAIGDDLHFVEMCPVFWVEVVNGTPLPSEWGSLLLYWGNVLHHTTLTCKCWAKSREVRSGWRLKAFFFQIFVCVCCLMFEWMCVQIDINVLYVWDNL